MLITCCKGKKKGTEMLEEERNKDEIIIILRILVQGVSEALL